jgi:hypothetical protein
LIFDVWGRERIMVKEEEFHWSLDEISTNLTGARRILLTINIVCAFLFLIVYELSLGWQLYRPSSSLKMYAYNLSVLTSNKNNGRLTEFEKGVVKIAHIHSAIIASDSFATEKAIGEKLKAYPIRQQEEFIRMFVADINNYEAFYKKNIEADIGSFYKDRIIKGDAAILIHPPYNDSLSLHNPKFGLAFIDTSAYCRFYKNDTIAVAIQEIQDRFKVDEASRGRIIEKRTVQLPIMSNVMQIEDVSIPVAIFLILMLYWVKAGFNNAYESARHYLKFVDDDKHLMTDTHYKEHLQALLSRFQFIDKNPQDSYHLKSKYRHWLDIIRHNIGKPINAKINVKYSIIWLFMGPYLVLMSSVIANAHEFLSLDYAFHFTNKIYEADTAKVFLLESFLLFISCAFLASAAWLITMGFVDISWRIENAYRRVNDPMLIYSMRSKAQFVFLWILAAPFVFFSTLSIFHSIGIFQYNLYFMNKWYVLGFLLIVCVYFMGFRLFLSDFEYSLKLRLTAIIILYFGLPIAYLIRIYFSSITVDRCIIFCVPAASSLFLFLIGFVALYIFKDEAKQIERLCDLYKKHGRDYVHFLAK